jgi:hypothetical protein
MARDSDRCVPILPNALYLDFLRKPATEMPFEIGDLPEAVSHVAYGSWKVFTLIRSVRLVNRTDLSKVSATE